MKLRTSRYTLNTNTQQVQFDRVLLENDYTYDTANVRLTNTISSQTTNTDGTPATNPDGSPLLNGRTEQYGYDSLNRLTAVDYGDGQTQSYSFDAMGNRLSKTDNGGGINGTENYTYNNANMLLSRSGNAYTNDADGNTLTGGGRTNTWDSQNRLVSCINGSNTSSFVYGADGIRRQSMVNGTTTNFVLDNSMFVREITGGVSKATYFVGARGPEYRRDDTNGQVRWYLYDGLGSVLGEVDPTGNVTAIRKYDVYGLVRSGDAGTSSQKFVGQLGHPSEDNTGLIYMRARYMDPTSGRFVIEDPGKQSGNWYCYCYNNPTNLTDRDGKFWDIGWLVGELLQFLSRPAAVRIELATLLDVVAEMFLVAGNAEMHLANNQFAGALELESAALADTDIISRRFIMQASETLFESACGLESDAITHIFMSEQLHEFAMLLRIDTTDD